MNETTKTLVPAAVAAAAWWAKQIGAPTYRMTDDRASAEEQANAGFAMAAMTLLSESHPVTAEAGEKFQRALAEAIDKQLTRDAWPSCSLHVDYGPDMVLAQAADAAGVSYSRFPWKTGMWIKRDFIVASLGYGARSALVWSAPDWQRPECGEHRYMDDEPVDEVCTLPRYHDDDHGEWKPGSARCAHCSGTYAEHYETSAWQRRREADNFHSYEPVEAAGRG